MEFQESIQRLAISLRKEGERHDPTNKTVPVRTKGKEIQVEIDKKEQTSIHLAAGLLRYAIELVLVQRNPQTLDALYHDVIEFLARKGFYDDSKDAYNTAETMLLNCIKEYPDADFGPTHRIVRKARKLLNFYLRDE